MASNSGWQQVAGNPWVATYEYSFGPGNASALAVQIRDGILVASPPCGVPDSAYADLSAHGRVLALVAPNAFHTLGIAPWKRRFPQAEVFAPEQSLTRIAARSGVEGIRPLRMTAALTGDRVSLIDMPHFKTGEALIKISMSTGLAWYVTDVLLNLQKLPRNLLAALVFRLSGSAPGLKLNRIAPLFMVKDKRALRRWFRDEAQRDQPRWLIPAHGPVVDLAETPTRLASLFE